jgi:hypothetical protein
MAFNGYEYIQKLARRLVLDFEDAGMAPTPGLKGAAREQPSRVQLEQLLPGDVGVGSGIVVDSFGGQSMQQDIVIYEKHRCPVFTVNWTPEATFFPVEGVIAVGEVKSSLNTETLTDAFDKIASAKRLRRRAEATSNGVPSDPTVSFRHYGSILSAACAKEEEFSQRTKSLDQLYGFLLCGKFILKPETVLQRVEELSAQTPKADAPNGIFSLNDGFLVPYNAASHSIHRSAVDARSLFLSKDPERAFAQLIWYLRLYIEGGRTVETRHFRRYYEPNSEMKPGLYGNGRWQDDPVEAGEKNSEA